MILKSNASIYLTEHHFIGTPESFLCLPVGASGTVMFSICTSIRQHMGHCDTQDSHPYLRAVASNTVLFYSHTSIYLSEHQICDTSVSCLCLPVRASDTVIQQIHTCLPAGASGTVRLCNHSSVIGSVAGTLQIHYSTHMHPTPR